jgi:hypothetical protein
MMLTGRHANIFAWGHTGAKFRELLKIITGTAPKTRPRHTQIALVFNWLCDESQDCNVINNQGYVYCEFTRTTQKFPRSIEGIDHPTDPPVTALAYFFGTGLLG